jgi:hypothetical protein
MSKDGIGNRVLNHVDPSRRDFVKRVLAGAAFAAPVVASFSIESLYVNAAYGQSSSSSSASSSACNISGSCRCLADPGYVGPAVFQAYVEDTSGNTRVNGELAFVIRGDGDFDRDDPNGTVANVSFSLTKDAQVTSAYLTINGQEVATIPLEDSHELGKHDLTGKIKASDLLNLCDFDALLQAMASQQVVAVVQGTYSGWSFNAQGSVTPASASPIIEIKA